MKKVLILLAVLAAVATNAEAQRKQIYLGPSLLFKAGVNAGNIQEGQKTGVNFHFLPDIGMTFKYMFSKNSAVGAVLDIEYTTYSFRMRPESESAANDNNTYVFQPSYFSIAPNLFLSGVTIGAAFGFPMSYSSQTVAGNEGMLGYDSSDDLNSPSIELRLGGMIKVMESDGGELNILIRGGYMVTGLYNTDAAVLSDYFRGTGSDRAGDPATFNPALVSGGIGVNYLFDLADL